MQAATAYTGLPASDYLSQPRIVADAHLVGSPLFSITLSIATPGTSLFL
jgi:hypothetical protein